MINNLETVVSKLKSLLPQYLELHGRIPENKRFVCINPEHNDHSPSAQLDPHRDFTMGKCFSCGCTFDIFTAALWLEGLPMEGEGFITRTVVTLAKELGLNLEYIDSTPEEKENAVVLNIYSAAHDYVISEKLNWPSDIESYLALHKWSKKDLAKYGIGVGTREGLLNHLTQLGYSQEYLTRIGFNGKNHPIQENRLVFTIFDNRGRPIAFSSRGFGPGQKYINSTNSNIYTKGNILYGFNWVHHNSKQIIVTEGNGDVISSLMLGMENVVAVCGTAFTKEQVWTLQRHGFHTITLALDFDKAGQDATEKAINNIHEVSKEINVNVFSPHTEWKDLGEFIENEGVEGFRKGLILSAFDWLLARRQEVITNTLELANSMISTIAGEPNAILRESQCRALAEATGVSLFAIESEVKKASKVHQVARKQAQSAVLTKLIDTANNDPDSCLVATQHALRELEDISKEYSVSSVSNIGFISMLDKQKMEEETRFETNQSIGFKLPLMPALEKIFSDGDDWSQSSLFLLGGEENTGKSSYLSFFGMNIIAAEENDAIWICFSIDDTSQQISPKLITVADSLLQKFDPRNALTIGNVRNLKSIKTDNVLKRRDAAYGYVKGLAENERLILKDAKDGNTLSYLDSVVRFYRNRYPSRKIFITVDNTHNLADYSNMEDRSERYKRIANAQKAIVNKYDALMFATVEYTKGTQHESKDIVNMMPDNNRIAETRALKYLGNLIAHLYNDIHSRPNLYDVFHTDPLTNSHLPRILMRIGKTKFNGFKGTLTWDFYPGSSMFIEVPEERAKLERKKFLASRKAEEEGDDDGAHDENW